LIEWIFQRFYFTIWAFITVLFVIDSKEIIISGRFHSSCFGTTILDQFYIRWCKSNCGLINSGVHQLLIFLELFFKNVHSFSFIIKVINQEYFIEYYLQQGCCVHLLTSSCFMQILSLFFFNNLNIYHIVLLCITTFFSMIIVLWIPWMVIVHLFNNIFNVVLVDIYFYDFQLSILLFFFDSNDYVFSLQTNFISYFKILPHFQILSL
jgi:hypothetical protein